MTSTNTLSDVERLRAVLDGPRGDIRALVREQLERPELAPAIDLDTEEHRARVARQLQLVVDLGGSALGFPAAYGGYDDVGGSVVAFETLAFGDLSLVVKSGVQLGLFGGAILHLGTARHHEAYLPGVIDLTLPGCFAMTETGHGSDVQSLRTTATYDPSTDELVVHTPDVDARKDYIGGAARDAHMAVVFAQLHVGDTGHGVHAVMVPIRDDDGAPCPGVTISDCGPKMGLNGVDNGRLSFDGVRVARTALLDRFGSITADGTYTSPIANETRRFFTMIGTLIQGRISVAGGALAATKTALTIAVRYGLERRQFAPPDGGDEIVLMDYRAHQRRLLPAVATTYALSFAQNALVADLDTAFGRSEPADRERRELETRAAGVKALATWHATAVIQTCREACGGAGYLSVNRLGQLKADTDVFSTFEGDNTVLLQLVAKGLLTDYREQFDSLDTFATVRFVADQVASTVAERVSVRPLAQALMDAVPGREQDTDLRERGWHLALLTGREKHVLDTLARRLKAGIDAGRDAFTVFNDCQDHVLLVARAHIERVVLESVTEVIEGVDDADTAELLTRVCDLHALSLIERDRAWFMEHGRLSGARAKGVVDAVNRLCDELRPQAGALVEAFGVPDACVAAPIALGDHTSPPPSPPAC